MLIETSSIVTLSPDNMIMGSDSKNDNAGEGQYQITALCLTQECSLAELEL